MKDYFLLIISFAVAICTFAQNDLTPTDQLALAKFTIVDSTGIPEEGAVVKVEAVDKKFTKQATADIDGKCAILIPEGVPFKLVVNKFEVDFDFGIQNIDIKPGPHTANFKLSIQLVTVYKRVYRLNHLFFEPNQYEISGLKAESIKTLNNLVDTLKNNPRMKLEVAGHTDNQGDAIANLHLSQKRADAIREYLIQKGISGKRLLAKGYGHQEPISDNATPQGRAFNRRTEIRVIEE